MRITVDELDEHHVALRPQGRLDLVTASRLRNAVDDIVEAGRTGVVVDLSGVTFMDSSGLGMLIAGLKRARQAGGELRIAAPGAQVLTALELTKLTRLLQPYGSVDEALEGM